MLRYQGKTFHLEFHEDRPFVGVYHDADYKIADLFVLSSVHQSTARDDTTFIGEWKITKRDDETVFTLKAGSSIWDQKEFRFLCTEEKFVYEIELTGEGHLDQVDYFGGYFSGQLRWGSGFFWSGQNFLQGMNPEPNVDEKIYFSPETTTKIDLMGVPLPARGDWFFTPAPFCFPIAYEGGWIGLGLEADPGRYRFTCFTYHGTAGAFHLSLDYEGYTFVRGKATLPAVGFVFSDEPYEVLRAHIESVKRRNLDTVTNQSKKPSWWQSPIFCGWGEQCYLASKSKEQAASFSTQKNYENFLEILSVHFINPGIVVLDDKWQETYGENEADTHKWPDIHRFIDQQHQRGRKVLLWLKAWDPEGLPAEECITNASGSNVSVDPSHPQFEQNLRKQVQHMLSDDGYDADGFKIDFTARIPSGPGMHLQGDVWGLELMRLYLSILSDEAKRVKKDALIMAHTPHPYLADLVDMIRLNDINIEEPVNPAMIHRAKVAKIACPDAIIDTDNWPMKDKASWRHYLSIQAELGVPSLYFATHIASTGEVFNADDYALIRKTWKQAQK